MVSLNSLGAEATQLLLEYVGVGILEQGNALGPKRYLQKPGPI